MARICNQCGYIEGTDPEKSWRWHSDCGGDDVCEDCWYGHYYTCDICRSCQDEDQAQLAADQLGKRGKFPQPYTTANDEAALLLADRRRRAYAQWEEI